MIHVKLILTAIEGVILGSFTGIMPGIHVNTAIIFLATIFPPNLSLVVLVISASIAHTFADVIPSTFLGVPDESFAVSVYPAHEMAMDGRGFEAVSTATFSGVAATLLSLPLFFLILHLNYMVVKEFTLPVLAAVSLFIIAGERGDFLSGRFNVWFSRLKALAVFLLSGVLGIVAFGLSFNGLLPLFSGLFAFPVLYQGFRSGVTLPESERKVSFRMKSTLTGTVSGALVSLFPGISSGVASAIAVSPFSESDSESYVSAAGAANTANAILCLSVLSAFGKARNGAALALKATGFTPGIQLIPVLTFSAFLSAIVTLLLADLFDKTVAKINQKILSFLSLLIVLLAVFALTGVEGMALFAVSSAAGMLPVKLGVRRLNCMGCLLLPLILIYAS